MGACIPTQSQQGSQPFRLRWIAGGTSRIRRGTTVLTARPKDSMKYTCKIKKRDGSLEFLGNPPQTLRLPDAKRERFSEIIPVNPWLRRAFRILRALFGEEGAVANWTRRWHCKWICIILRGPAQGHSAQQFGHD